MNAKLKFIVYLVLLCAVGYVAGKYLGGYIFKEKIYYYHYSFVTRDTRDGRQNFFDGIAIGEHFPKATALLDSCKIAKGTVDPNDFTIISITQISKEDYESLRSDTTQYSNINKCTK